MSSQVWICVSEGDHWGPQQAPDDPKELGLWASRNSLYAAKMALIIGTRLRVVYGLEACMVTSSDPGAPSLVLSFDSSMSPDLASKIEKDLREFASKEWSRPTMEPLDGLRKIPRSPLVWNKGVVSGSSDNEQSLSPAQQKELSRQEKEFEMALQNQGPRTMSWDE